MYHRLYPESTASTALSWTTFCCLPPVARAESRSIVPRQRRLCLGLQGQPCEARDHVRDGPGTRGQLVEPTSRGQHVEANSSRPARRGQQLDASNQPHGPRLLASRKLAVSRQHPAPCNPLQACKRQRISILSIRIHGITSQRRALVQLACATRLPLG
ncbi:hypothetical protein CDD82_2320 [Ophiocordyceps australis]|uniref:Uncharacterized protein n=1 Tax=Ophiocordyceps australis TaxID=1399860 RepID=A0A2C5ZHQ9_9HYPO|nr:hypothetical protein CDD82_2320 [Ophiocordyceps australis]